MLLRLFLYYSSSLKRTQDTLFQLFTRGCVIIDLLIWGLICKYVIAPYCSNYLSSVFDAFYGFKFIITYRL